MASYVSLAFGRYVVEPFFTPCAAPIVLIKVVSILGVSEWLRSTASSPPRGFLRRKKKCQIWADVPPPLSLISRLPLCPRSVYRGGELLERDLGLSHSGGFDVHQDVRSGSHHRPRYRRAGQRCVWGGETEMYT